MLGKRAIMPALISLLMVFTAVCFCTGDVCAADKGAGTSIKEATVTISPLTYNGQVQKPVITLKIGETILIEKTDYTLEFSNPSSINAGKYKVTITGTGDYTGKLNEQYSIEPKKITPSVTLSAKSFVFSGAEQKPNVTAVKDGDVTIPDSEYSVSYDPAACVDVGAYTVTVAFKEKANYAGSTALKYKINPVGTSLKTPARGHKLIKVKWKPQTATMSKSNITGYQIRLATNKSFTKNKKTVTAKGYSTAVKKVTKLKGGKKYFIQIRTYMKVDGATCYSKWSKPKTATTRR